MEPSVRRKFLLGRGFAALAFAALITIATFLIDMSAGDRLAVIGLFGGAGTLLAATLFYGVRKNKL